MEDEKRNKRWPSDDSFVAVDDDDDEDHRLLSRLLSQLETLKGDGILQQAQASTDPDGVAAAAVGNVESQRETKNEVNSDSSEIGREEIIRELRKVKRQNFITHCLLSVMIVLTVAWQMSEVSLILTVKDVLSHPFRSFGSVLTRMLKGPNIKGKQLSIKPFLIESSSLPALKIPELPHVELPNFDLNSDEE